MAISETVLILAGGTAVLSILFGIRLAMRAAGGAATAPQSDSGASAAAGGSGMTSNPPKKVLSFRLDTVHYIALVTVKQGGQNRHGVVTAS